MKYFTRDEMACKCGCGFNTVDYELATVLDDVREHFGRPTTINSGCRCETHNTNVGGAAKSVHKTGQAADFKVKGVKAGAVYKYLVNKYPGKYGIGRYKGRTHIDVKSGPARRWDSR